MLIYMLLSERGAHGVGYCMIVHVCFLIEECFSKKLVTAHLALIQLAEKN